MPADLQEYVPVERDYRLINLTLSSGLPRNESGNQTFSLDIFQAEPYLTGILIFLYVVIWLIGVFGNIMVLYVVIKYDAMRTVTNKFIACLSISDLAICIFAIPFTPLNALTPSWVLGELLCKLVPYILSSSVFLSTLVSVIIGVDRFLVIIYPHRQRMGPKLQIAIILTTAVLSALASLPVVIFTVLVDNADGSKSCKESIPDAMYQHYTWFVLSVQLIVPAIILTICYTAISIKLHRRTNLRSSTRVEHKIKAEALRNRKINRMLIAMVTIFIGCWLPLDVIHFLLVYVERKYRISIFLVTHAVAMSSVMYNPILYGWMNENFNKYFVLSLPWLKHIRKSRTRHSDKLTHVETFQKHSSIEPPAREHETLLTKVAVNGRLQPPGNNTYTELPDAENPENGENGKFIELS